MKLLKVNFSKCTIEHIDNAMVPALITDESYFEVAVNVTLKKAYYKGAESTRMNTLTKISTLSRRLQEADPESQEYEDLAFQIRELESKYTDLGVLMDNLLRLDYLEKNNTDMKAADAITTAKRLTLIKAMEDTGIENVSLLMDPDAYTSCIETSDISEKNKACLEKKVDDCKKALDKYKEESTKYYNVTLPENERVMLDGLKDKGLDNIVLMYCNMTSGCPVTSYNTHIELEKVFCFSQIKELKDVCVHYVKQWGENDDWSNSYRKKDFAVLRTNYQSVFELLSGDANEYRRGFKTYKPTAVKTTEILSAAIQHDASGKTAHNTRVSYMKLDTARGCQDFQDMVISSVFALILGHDITCIPVQTVESIKGE